MAYPEYIKKNEEMISGFLRAIKKAYLYIYDNPSIDVGKALVKSFDGSSAESLATAIESYMRIDAWKSSPAMSRDSFNRLLTVLKNAKTLDKNANIDFTKIVDNTLANQI